MTAVAGGEDVRWVTVATREELSQAEDRRLVCTGRGWQLLLLEQDDRVYAVENRCSHATARLEQGALEGCQLICPLHGARFDIRDGACKGPPATQPIRSFAVRVAGNEIEVALPEKPPAPKPKYGVFN